MPTPRDFDDRPQRGPAPRPPASRAPHSRGPDLRPSGPRPPAPNPFDPAPRAIPGQRPPLRIFTTTLWEYPSQHYDAYIDAEGALKRTTITRAGLTGRQTPGGMQGDKAYVGATPSWVIWQLLMRYTRPGDVVLDPMCGSGTTIDVCRDLGREPRGFDLAPSRPDIAPADARRLPLPDASVDFAFVDPPYSTHVDYSDDPRCIGKLDSGGPDRGVAYYEAMARVIAEMHRALRPRRYMGLYVSDSFKKAGAGRKNDFMPIGFELFALMREKFQPVDIISVVRHNQKLQRGNWRKAAEEGNFFLRGFNYLFIMKKS
jgi:SAM-dependent methyltransferase